MKSYAPENYKLLNSIYWSLYKILLFNTDISIHFVCTPLNKDLVRSSSIVVEQNIAKIFDVSGHLWYGKESPEKCQPRKSFRPKSEWSHFFRIRYPFSPASSCTLFTSTTWRSNRSALTFFTFQYIVFTVFIRFLLLKNYKWVKIYHKCRVV